MKDFEKQLGWLVEYEVDFVVIGGVAAAIYGSSIVTHDLDICYARTATNLEKLAVALGKVNARLRGAREGLPFILDVETLRHGLNFTFTTDIGDIDLLGEVRGVGGYEEALEGATRSASVLLRTARATVLNLQDFTSSLPPHKRIPVVAPDTGFCFFRSSPAKCPYAFARQFALAPQKRR